jgi:hypothetical protein
MGYFTLTYRGRFRVVPEGKSDAETRATLVDTFELLGVPTTPHALGDAEIALDAVRHRGRVVGSNGLTIRYDQAPFNPVTEVTEVKTIN